MRYLFIVLLFISGAALADCDTQCPVTDANVGAYYNADHFRWTNYNDAVHLMAGYSISLVTGLLLEHKAGLPRWEAALLGSLAAASVGVIKETMFDTYTSRTDIKMWSAGGIAGGLTIMTLSF